MAAQTSGSSRSIKFMFGGFVCYLVDQRGRRTSTRSHCSRQGKRRQLGAIVTVAWPELSSSSPGESLILKYSVPDCSGLSVAPFPMTIGLTNWLAPVDL